MYEELPTKKDRHPPQREIKLIKQNITMPELHTAPTLSRLCGIFFLLKTDINMEIMNSNSANKDQDNSVAARTTTHYRVV